MAAQSKAMHTMRMARQPGHRTMSMGTSKLMVMEVLLGVMCLLVCCEISGVGIGLGMGSSKGNIMAMLRRRGASTAQ